jgi:hypothetical protein
VLAVGGIYFVGLKYRKSVESSHDFAGRVLEQKNESKVKMVKLLVLISETVN